MQKQITRKGVLGLDTVKVVILTLLVLSVIAIASFAALNPLMNTSETMSVRSGSPVVNETWTGSISTVGTLTTPGNVRNCVATVSAVQNATEPTILPSSNYTISGCTIVLTANSLWDADDLVIRYTYKYNDPSVYNWVNNITSGTGKFFNQVPTFFTLLGVVVLILLISIVIVAVTRFSPGMAGKEGL